MMTLFTAKIAAAYVDKMANVILIFFLHRVTEKNPKNPN